MGKFNYAELLYSQPSLLEGFARVLDLGVFDDFSDSATSVDADRLAMMSDWYAISSDLDHAVRGYSPTVAEKVPGDPNGRSD